MNVPPFAPGLPRSLLHRRIWDIQHRGAADVMRGTVTGAGNTAWKEWGSNG